MAMTASAKTSGWRPETIRFALVVFLCVSAAQMWAVARLGSEVPWGDSWDAEGRRLYPAIVEGESGPGLWFRPHNEHRIVFTHILNEVLFRAAGQWDPLLQMLVGVVFRSAAAMFLVVALCSERFAFSLVIALAYLPLIAWHNVLWAFQSQVFFSLGWGVLALWLGATGVPRGWQWWCGVMAAVCSMLSMGAGFLLPIVWILLSLSRVWIRRSWSGEWRQLAAASVLLAVAVALRVEVPAHAGSRATGAGQFAAAFLTAAAWPHVKVPWAALVINLPLAVGVIGMLLRRMRLDGRCTEMAVALGAWGLLIAAGAAFSRGAGPEFANAVPSRYVDFIVLIVLANAWWLARLVGVLTAPRRAIGLTLAGLWGVFVLAGWIGLSVQTWNGVLAARWSDRDEPVRRLREFQLTGEGMVFFRVSRLVSPHSNLRTVRDSLADPRLEGRLPPALQPASKVSRLSQAARFVRSRADGLLALMLAGAVFLSMSGRFHRGAGTATRVSES